MVEKVHNWVYSFHLGFVFLLAIPAFFGVQEKLWIILIIAGLLTMIQCFHYISMEEGQELKKRERYLHRVCVLSSIVLVTAYLMTTRYWWYSPLYYLVTNPQSKKERYVSLFLPICGSILVWVPDFISNKHYPIFMLALLAVMSITYLFYLIEKGLRNLLVRDRMLSEQMKVTALNELKVRNLNRELAMKYQLADLNARLEEREQISRNIHNVVGHTITSAIVSLQAYRILKESEPERSEDKLEAATNRMRLALEEIRRAVRVLDLETQEISLKDFQQLMIAELLRFSMDTDLNVSHNLDYLDDSILDQSLDKRCCEFLHSVLTECFNNGIRHGNATSFVVFMHVDTNTIGLSVTDNGSGFQMLTKAEQENRIGKGYGIKKMKQFALEHGGSMKVSTENGFRVYIELPIRMLPA